MVWRPPDRVRACGEACMYRSIITIESSRAYVRPTNLRRRWTLKEANVLPIKNQMTGVMRALDGVKRKVKRHYCKNTNVCTCHELKREYVNTGSHPEVDRQTHSLSRTGDSTMIQPVPDEYETLEREIPVERRKLQMGRHMQVVRSRKTAV